jgi:hypothetical protein
MAKFYNFTCELPIITFLGRGFTWIRNNYEETRKGVTTN